ncbi:MAG: hypothetical protein ABH827_03325 [bacterium]
MIEIIKKEKNFLFFIFLSALLIRALVFGFYLGKNNNFWQVDSNTYHVTAIQVAQGHGFSHPDGKPNFYRLPGYSAFIAIYYKIFGTYKTFDTNKLIGADKTKNQEQDKKNALWMQVILAALIPLLIFLLSRALFPNNLYLAKLASLYSCFHLGLVLYAGFFMTETLFIFLLLIFFILFFSSTHLFFCNTKDPETGKKFPVYTYPPFFLDDEETGPEFIKLYDQLFGEKFIEQYKTYITFESTQTQRAFRYMLFAGLTLGLASLVRPVGPYLIITALLVLIVSKNNWSNKIGKSFILFLGWLIPVLLWLIRNYIFLGHIFFHTLPGGHFLHLSAARVAMHVHNTSYEHAREILTQEVARLELQEKIKKHRPLNEIELCKLREHVAIIYFKAQPLITLKNWATDMFRTCFSLYSAELLYLDSGRQEINYFEKNRSFWSLFKRYLFPQTKNIYLKVIIFLEITLFLFILLGFLLFMLTRNPNNWCVLLKTLPFMGIFIIISLAGGYARMRLPIEPLLIIISLAGWSKLFKQTDTSL